MLDRRRFVALSCALTLAPILGPHVARAQAAWPSRSVKVIVPFAPGGATDIIARTIGNRLSEVWGQQVVVESRGGGDASIGTAAVAQSDPDGYTMLLSSVGQAINRFLYPSLTYDPVADFAPVSLICLQPNIMVVPNASPAKSVKEFVAYAKSRSGQISFGSGGVGTSVHLSGELFKRMTGVEMTHVPYRGSAPALQDVIAGRLDLIFDNITPALPHVKSGSARGLAVTTSKRVIAAVDLPTIAEAGVPGFEVDGWYGLLAPKATPAPVIRRFNAELAALLAMDEMKERLLAAGIDASASSPAEFHDRIARDITRWSEVVKKARIAAE